MGSRVSAPWARFSIFQPKADKESHKWLSALRERVSMTPSEVRLVTIADREADIFEFLAEAGELEAEYVIRAAQDRRLSGEAELLWAHMATQAVVRNGHGRGGRARRKAGTACRPACACRAHHPATTAARG
jgi:hypothetical protein